MGVRGLTTYIASNAERFLDPYELHDTDLVIDGDNLCFQLFVRSEERMGAFGGNYDHYFRAVVEFFELLRKCNVQPWVLLDGGYEQCKLKTVRSRMLGRIQFVKSVRPGSNRLIIPLLVREVFVDAMWAAKVSFMRCLFEADNEVAILARKLNCPVLSYDSDFYIHNVKYIPYVTLNHKIYRKVIENEENFKIELLNRKGGKNRSKRVLLKQGDGPLEEENVQDSYCYLDCSLYTIENLIGKDERLKPEMLPLFAALLGNDYISRRILSKFYASMKVGKISRKVAVHQRRVVAILKWLKYHSLKSATMTIMNQVQEKHRDGLLKQLEGAMYGYNCEECQSFEFFGFEEDHTETLEDGADKLRDYLANAEDGETVELEESDDEAVDEEITENETNSDDGNSEGEESEEVEDDTTSPTANPFNWEPWLLEIYQAALTPRFVVDLYHSCLYINYPQVENINEPDSNELCYDLLRYIFSLLKSSKNANYFRYLTRCERVAQFRWLKFENVEMPEGVNFNPNKRKNVALLKVAFRDFSNCEEIFTAVSQLPANMQLYFLCLVFWATKQPAVTPVHVHALIVCLIQLQMIDKRLPNKSRDAKVFHKNQKAYLDNQRKAFQKTEPPSQELPSKATFKKLTTAITKPEAILTYDLLLTNFSINDRMLRRHGELDRPTAHIYAQLQAVVLNLFTLNGLLGHPLEPTRMHEFYNGLFIHNLYQSLKSRQDPLDYIKGTVFRYSGTMFAIHRMLYEWLVRLVPQFETRMKTTRTVKKVPQMPKESVQRKKEQVKQMVENDCLLDSKSSEEDEDDAEYNDLNNQFSQLLVSGQ
ncbi:AAEL007237-PA [Aedes aegypti]|uniref:AAEL007237-PA n=1 Tax=Aedes aegypti TaxID=7159 RepID=Q172X9_AEDAE|nr:AAEL007237-PA [Aedes aegypti]